MQYRTHITVSLAVGLPMLAAVDQVTFINTAVLVCGSVLPDIDHPKSFIGKRSQVVSKVANKTLGHRGATHSLVVAAGVYLLALFNAKAYLATAAMHLPFWLLIGYLLHLIEDSFSKNSIHWFWPFSKFKKSARKRLFYYRTGHVSEYLILGFALCLLLIELNLLWSGHLTSLFDHGWAASLKLLIAKLQLLLLPH